MSTVVITGSNIRDREAIDGWTYADVPRAGDHIWWISSTRRCATRYRGWHQRYDLRATLEEMLEQHASGRREHR